MRNSAAPNSVPFDVIQGRKVLCTTLLKISAWGNLDGLVHSRRRKWSSSVNCVSLSLYPFTLHSLKNLVSKFDACNQCEYSVEIICLCVPVCLCFVVCISHLILLKIKMSILHNSIYACEQVVKLSLKGWD